MRAMVLDAPGAALRAEQRDDLTGPDVITITACGVCHSDLHVVDGVYPSPMPLVLGHEITGVHGELGPVMVYAPWGCRSCEMCAGGQEMICPNSTELGLFQDGGYAEQLVVTDRRYLHPLGGLDPITSAPLACGGLTAYRATNKTLDTLRAAGGRGRVLVLGAGGLGQFAIQYLRLLTDATVVVGDLSTAKQHHALQLGAHEAADPADIDEPCHAVIDFVGSDATLTHATRLVRRQGIGVIVGLFGGRAPFGFGAVAHESTWTTSVWGTNDQLAELLALARRHPITATVEAMPLSAAQTAHDRLRSGDATGRFVLVPSLDHTTGDPS
jgi:alcohol dehydrogenase, propanol-preferring